MSERCYWATEDGKKFWIPGCHQGLYREDGYCACRAWDREQAKRYPTEKQKEAKYKKLYNEVLKENARLVRLINKLSKKNIF